MNSETITTRLGTGELMSFQKIVAEQAHKAGGRLNMVSAMQRTKELLPDVYKAAGGPKLDLMLSGRPVDPKLLKP